MPTNTASRPAVLPLAASILLFCLSLTYFIDLGPWRAVHWANAYDFASVYGATRNWLLGQNPYDMQLVTAEVHRAGNDPAKFANADPIQPSVYLPTAFPILSAVAWMSWVPARLVWSCLSTVVFALSLLLIFANVRLPSIGKWLLAAGLFAFSPTSLGLSHGNPTVIACGLTMLAVYCVLNRRRDLLAAFLLGLAHCLKPQLSIAAVALFILWGCWRPLLLSILLPTLAAVLSVLRAPSFTEYGHWLATLQQALAESALPGSINDPGPANHYAFSIANVQTLVAVWIHNPSLTNVLTWLIAAAIVICYLYCSRQLRSGSRLRDMAFFSAVSLTVVYHRFYDEQLLLMSIPFLLASRKTAPSTIALWLCILALALPLHVLSGHVPAFVAPNTLVGLLTLRPQPLLLLAICLLTIPWTRAHRTSRISA